MENKQASKAEQEGRNIKSSRGRNQLEPRREPYWERVQTGLYVGYRKLAAGEGTWIARHQVGKSKKYYAIGTIVDRDAFDKAVIEAQKWLATMEAGVSTKPLTVADVCKAYVEALKTENSLAASNDAKGRFNRLVYDKKIGKILLSKLTTLHVKEWRDAQVNADADDEDVKRDKDSANRNLSSLKAALNAGLGWRLVATDAGWKTVTAFRDVGRRRVGVLKASDRAELLSKCDAHLAKLVKAMMLTAARPGELANLTVKDFDKAEGTIALTGKTGYRIATLSTAAIAFFTEVSKNRIANAPMLTNEAGKKWDKDQWKKPFKAAVVAAKLPSSTVMYTLRHTAITELVNNGELSTFQVAKLVGTSTAMIDKFYGELIHNKTRARLDAVAMV